MKNDIGRTNAIRKRRLEAAAIMQETDGPAETRLEKMLWPFQRADVAAMKKMETFINANEMGMGKTVESIVFSDSIGADVVLVVCNNRLLYHWE